MADSEPAPEAPASPEPAPGGNDTHADGEHSDSSKDAPKDSPKDEPGDSPAEDASDAAASKATSSAGGGSRRAEYLRDAEHPFLGDVVGQKNVFFTDGSRRRPPQRLSSDLREPARSAFVEPPDWAEARARFRHRTAILRGPAGRGKTTAAIRLLLPATVYQLDATIDLNRLSESVERDGAGGGIERGAGFLLTYPTRLAGLRASALQRIDEELRRADARLVIVCDDTPLPDQDLLDYAIDLPAAPDFHAVAVSHLRRLLGDGLAGLLLSDGAVRAVVKEQLAWVGSCEMAARLAEWIAHEHESHGRVDAARIRLLMAQRGAAEFDIWFSSLGDTETRCYAIALAVLNGLAQERVAAAAHGLYQRMARTESIVVSSPADGPYDGAGPFRHGGVERLRRLRAEVTTVTTREWYGESSAEGIAYREEHRAPSVLRHAWSQYQIHGELIAWLGELADDADDRVRVHAGLALGQLATASFDYIVGTVLAGWAGEENRGRQEAVSFALRHVVRAEPGLTPQVRKWANSWYGTARNRFRQATAARVYGVCLGPLDPGAAIERLARLLAAGDEQWRSEHRIDVAWAIGDAVCDLLEMEDPDTGVAGLVLRMMERQADDRDRTASAQLAFLILADSLVMRDDDGRAKADAWPYLLGMAQRHPEIRQPTVALWRRAMTESYVHRQAQAVLTDWARRGESDGELREAVLRLLRSIARGDPRCRRILAGYADDWVAPGNLRPLPELSRALRAVVAAERGHQ